MQNPISMDSAVALQKNLNHWAYKLRLAEGRAKAIGKNQLVIACPQAEYDSEDWYMTSGREFFARAVTVVRVTTEGHLELLRHHDKVRETITKAPKTELWWQKKDREERELRSRNAALHLEIRRITGME